MKAFVFDVESIGLHGEGFAVGGGIFHNGACIREFRYACFPSLAKGAADDRTWVQLNIPFIAATHKSPSQVRTAFWKEWMTAKEMGCVAYTDCGWPVEARFLAECVSDDPKRNWEGPYPLMEIASYLSAAGMDPMAKYDRTPSEPLHDPLGDARQSARLLFQALNMIGLTPC